jgi:hypothetical protein
VVKAWKAMLYYRMHQIHKQHAIKLSTAYFSRRLMHMTLKSWSFYTFTVLPAERASLFADHARRRAVQRTVLEVLRQRSLRRRALKHKLQSTILVLRAQRVRRYMAAFKVGIAHA